MANSAHIQSKHIVEYADSGTIPIRYADAIYNFLDDHGVEINTVEGSDTTEWEVEKEHLRSIPDEDYNSHRWPSGITGDDVRDFVADMIDAPTGEYAYVSWF